MELFVAGVIHHDVMGRHNLRRWLQNLRDTHDKPPAFIAAEYASDHFVWIESQRDTLADLAADEWPDAPPQLISALAPTLAYEADTHIEVFPKTPHMLWLDESTPEPYEGARCSFVEDRLKIYHHLWQRAASPTNVPQALAAMSRAAWDHIDEQQQATPPRPGTRDDDLARTIMERVTQDTADWAIIVVGKNRASVEQGFMARRLLDAGIPCCISILDPRRGIDRT